MASYKFGRSKILTDYICESMYIDNGLYDMDNVITPENIAYVLSDCLKQFNADNNRPAIERLFAFYRGEQEILNRKKTIRPDVDNKVILDFALSNTRTAVGYTYDKPVTYILKGVDEEKRDLIQTLNTYMDNLNKDTLDTEKGEDASICGTSFAFVAPSVAMIGANPEIPFTLSKLDPCKTFVAYHTSNTKLKILACTYYTTTKTGSDGTASSYYIFTVYTNDYIYLFKTPASTVSMQQGMPSVSAGDLVKVLPNPIGAIPIVEYPNNQYRLGDWEATVSIFNALNSIMSDSINDIQQFVSSILVILGAELPTRECVDPVSGDIVEVTDTTVVNEGILTLINESGGNIDAKYISKQLDSAGVSRIYDILDKAYHAINGIPDRKTNSDSGGDTGEAVTQRDGWKDLDIVAGTKEKYYKEAEQQTLSIILKIGQMLNDAVLGNLSVFDIETKFSRNKTDNLMTKANFIATLNNTKLFDPADLIEIAELVLDSKALIERGEEYRKLNDIDLVEKPPMITPIVEDNKDENQDEKAKESKKTT